MCHPCIPRLLTAAVSDLFSAVFPEFGPRNWTDPAQVLLWCRGYKESIKDKFKPGQVRAN